MKLISSASATKEAIKINIQEEYEQGKIVATPIEGTQFQFLRAATTEEKPVKTSRGYSWYVCSCGQIVIRRNGIVPKECNCDKRRGKRKLSFEERKHIAQFYQIQPITYQEMCEKFLISRPTLEKILRQFHIKIWNQAQLFSPNLQEHFFENIDTDEKGYFLGLLITDGNIFQYSSATHQISVNLTLQENDKYILEKFQKAVQSNRKITNDGRGCCQVMVLSTIMTKDLEQYGITPQKTFTIRFPFNVPKQYYSAIFRGIIDGDGSIGFYSQPGKKVHSKSIRLCSASKEFLQDIQMLLSQELNIQPRSIRQEKENLWTIGYGAKNDLEKIISWMYKDSTIYLFRKKEKCDLILNEISQYRDK